MDRMGHAQIVTAQKHLRALPDADQKNLAAFNRTLNRGQAASPIPDEGREWGADSAPGAQSRA